MADNRIDDLRRRLQRDPGSRLFAQLAEELRRAGEVDEAVRVARAGLERHPGYVSARLTLGRALLDAGDSAAARAELESTLREAPDNLLASRLLGEALESLGDVTGALARYRATLEMAPGDDHVKGRVQALESRLGAGGARGPAGAQAGEPGTPRSGGQLPPTVRIQMPPEEARPGRAPLPPTRGDAAEAPRTAPPPPLAAGADAGGDDTPEGAESLPATLPLGARTSEFDPRAAGEATSDAAARGDDGEVGSGTVEVAESVDEPSGSGDGAPAGGPARPLSSATLAELYFEQGLLERASEVYRQVVEEEPGNESARRRLAEIEAEMRESRVEGHGAAPASGEDREARRRALESTIEKLEALLVVVRGGG